MKLFNPSFWLKNVFQITETFLRENEIKGLLLDLDNTLSMHGSPVPEDGVCDWIKEMSRCGISLVVVSNNNKERVAPLAEKLELPFFCFSMKPLPFGYSKAIKAMNLPKKNIAAVGDQIFTDVLGGNAFRVRTILVEPFHLEASASFRLKRKIESVFFKRDYANLKKSGKI